MTSALQREIKKKTPFDLPEQEAMLNILRTADQLQIRFARLFRKFGLTPQQYNILRILRGEGRPLPILEIAARMITVVPGITGLIDRLETAEPGRAEALRQRPPRDLRRDRPAGRRKSSAEIDEPLNATAQADCSAT